MIHACAGTWPARRTPARRWTAGDGFPFTLKSDQPAHLMEWVETCILLLSGQYARWSVASVSPLAR